MNLITSLVMPKLNMFQNVYVEASWLFYRIVPSSAQRTDNTLPKSAYLYIGISQGCFFGRLNVNFNIYCIMVTNSKDNLYPIDLHWFISDQQVQDIIQTSKLVNYLR